MVFDFVLSNVPWNALRTGKQGWRSSRLNLKWGFNKHLATFPLPPFKINNTKSWCLCPKVNWIIWIVWDYVVHHNRILFTYAVLTAFLWLYFLNCKITLAELMSRYLFCYTHHCQITRQSLPIHSFVISFSSA